MQTPAQGVVMAPVSPAVAELLHQLQAQIIKEAQDRPVPPGAIILQPRGKPTRQENHEHGRGYRQVVCNAKDGSAIRLQTPFIADPKYSFQRPGVWYGSEDRVDEIGRRWSSTTARDYVMDDFGELVPVGAS